MSGLFGVVSKDSCSEYLLYGTDYHSHLGTEFGGVAVLGETFRRQIHDLNGNQFKSKFDEDIMGMNGNMGIGVISAIDEQPIYINSRFGPFCLVMDGIVNNSRELALTLLDRGITFSEVGKGYVNLTELVSKLITQGDSIVNGIEEMLDLISGSCSLLLLHKDGIYAARAKGGHSSLAIGRKGDSWAVTSETAAFSNLDFEVVNFLKPGEIALINKNGPVQKKEGFKKNQICSFLWIYIGFPATEFEGINVETVRERSGRALAKRDSDIEVDVVAGVPDSGIGHAIGYAIESKKPYRRPLVKYTPGYGRSYIPISQDMRDHIAKMKLIPNEAIIKGNRIVICEDSIVRGTQLKNFTIKKLWSAGAKEIHVRVACPPLMYPCKYNFSTRTINELAARKAIRELEGKEIEDISEYIDHTTDKYAEMVEWIREDLGVTTLRYQTIDDMVKSIDMPRKDLCLSCWTGKFPNSIED